MQLCGDLITFWTGVWLDFLCAITNLLGSGESDMLWLKVDRVVKLYYELWSLNTSSLVENRI